MVILLVCVVCISFLYLCEAFFVAFNLFIGSKTNALVFLLKKIYIFFKHLTKLMKNNALFALNDRRKIRGVEVHGKICQVGVIEVVWEI
jgi:hypothetical protein